jgi:hypothetical protein
MGAHRPPQFISSGFYPGKWATEKWHLSNSHIDNLDDIREEQ